jgi:amino acid adenylation domain-containing protein
MPFDKSLCIHQLFEIQADNSPDNIAVTFNEKKLTYSELNHAANNLATELIQKFNPRPDELIAVMLERSELMIIAILAVLKSGAAYLPLNPSNPVDYNVAIAQECSVKAVITDVNHIVIGDLEVLNISKRIESNVKTEHGNSVARMVTPDNLFVTLFTSGSTGKPKGVLLTQIGLICFLNGNVAEFGFTARDRFLQVSPFVFDFSLFEIFTPLLTGGTVVLLKPDGHLYAEEIVNTIYRERVTILGLTPAMLQVLVSYLDANPGEIVKIQSLKRTLTGGEKLTPKLANDFNRLIFQNTGTGLTNIYGPTEATIWVTTCNCESQTELATVTIGKPLGENAILIIDDHGKPVAKGQPGEIAIAGPQLARGYLNRPDLNKEKFIKNPVKMDELMYRTGDRGRFNDEDDIEFLGRTDHMIKLNGLRIELGEIESALLKNPYIKECCVLMREINDQKELVGYFTTAKPTLTDNVNIGDLIDHLSHTLPHYMVPHFYVQMDVFPLNTNGKIDRKNLPQPGNRYYKSQNYVEPSNPIEKAIAVILQTELVIEKIGVNDSLFDLGLKSLLLTKAIIKINKQLNSSISLQAFFQHPSIKQLADLVHHIDIHQVNPFVRIKEGEGSPLIMLPGAGGSPVDFIEFAKIHPVPNPVYSLAYPSAENFKHFDTIQAYTAYLIKFLPLIADLKAIELIGFSFGGVVAFEMAIQLKMSNIAISKLTLVSAPSPYRNNRNKLIGFFIGEPKLFFGNNYFMKKQYVKHRLPYLLGKAKKLIYDKREDVAQKILPLNINDTRPHQAQLFQNYKPTSKYRGDLLLINEEKTNLYEFYLEDNYELAISTRLWTRVIDGTITSKKIDCGHEEFFSYPNLPEVSNLIGSV